MNQNPHHSVRRIVLPSGKTIEVVRFHDSEEALTPGLHICPECDSNLVQPVDWSEAEAGQWQLMLECPNCWWTHEGLYPEDEIHDLEEELDQGLADMLRDLQRLAHANMADQIDRFTAALRADQILPEDF
jgi:hypothetical protein